MRKPRPPTGHADFHRVVPPTELAIAIDLGGNVLAVSTAVEKVTGWPEAEFLGHALGDFLRCAGGVPAKEAMLARSRKRPQRCTVRRIPLNDKSERLRGYILIIDAH